MNEMAGVPRKQWPAEFAEPTWWRLPYTNIPQAPLMMKKDLKRLESKGRERKFVNFKVISAPSLESPRIRVPSRRGPALRGRHAVELLEDLLWPSDGPQLQQWRRAPC